jgi:hypothetical protein
MILPFRLMMIVFAVLTGVITSYSVFAQEAVFDRLDGTGPSHKRVDVIEWEGNLEVHVYPKGSLKGLSAKLDDREKGKKVMVIGYRFANATHPLVRRAILGVPFHSQLKAYIVPSERDYDKLALSNRELSGAWKPFKLDAPPKQWYPDGDERNEEVTPQPMSKTTPVSRPSRFPAAAKRPVRDGSLNQYDF